MTTTGTARTDGVRTLGADDFEAAIEGQGVVLVEFVTEWCGTCTAMEPVLETVAAETDAAVLTVDIEDHLPVAIEYGARRSPSFVLFADGRPVERRGGRQSEDSLRSLVETYTE